jgi:hypothetical protein
VNNINSEQCGSSVLKNRATKQEQIKESIQNLKVGLYIHAQRCSRTRNNTQREKYLKSLYK